MAETAGFEIAEKIRRMSREEFWSIFVKRICTSSYFGKLASEGAKGLTVNERKKFIKALPRSFGNLTNLSNDDLDVIAKVIRTRSVAVR